jgi:hypothetical protein
MDFLQRMVYMKLARRLVLMGLLLLVFAAGSFAQSGQSLGKIAILPFTGGSIDEQEGIPELFSFTPELMQNFAVIPRTGITKAAEQEQSFQATSGMTDADTIAKLGNQVGADYVMAGSITSLGSKNLLIVSIVKIDVIRQVAGVYLVYDSLDELNRNEGILNSMADELVAMARSAPDGLDRLALLPVELQQGGNKQEGDALAQILAIHLLNIGTYAVYPRTGSLDQVMSEYDTQLKGGVTREDEAVKAGKAENPPYVLAVISRKIATSSRFNASITDLEKGNQIAGESEQYASLSDGMDAMEFLAQKLSGEEVSEKARQRRTRVVEEEKNDEARAAAAAESAKARAAATDKFLKNSGIAFGGWFAFGLGGDAPRVERKDKETGEIKKEKENVFDGGVDLELRLFRYLGIQTGVNIINDYASYTLPGEGAEKKYVAMNLLQIPLLVRLNFMPAEGKKGWAAVSYFSVYGGLGLNAAVLNATKTSWVNPGELGFIFGAEVGAVITMFHMFMGYRFSGGLDKGALTVNGASYDYSMGISMIQLGLRFYVPFRK